MKEWFKKEKFNALQFKFSIYKSQYLIEEAGSG
jgi:hypothetical protein